MKLVTSPCRSPNFGFAVTLAQKRKPHRTSLHNAEGINTQSRRRIFPNDTTIIVWPVCLIFFDVSCPLALQVNVLEPLGRLNLLDLFSPLPDSFEMYSFILFIYSYHYFLFLYCVLAELLQLLISLLLFVKHLGLHSISERCSTNLKNNNSSNLFELTACCTAASLGLRPPDRSSPSPCPRR